MKTVGDKKYQPQDYKPPETYDGMGKKDPYPGYYTPEPTIEKKGTVRGGGAATKGVYMSRNG